MAPRTPLPPGPRLGLSRILNARDPLFDVAALVQRYGDPMTIPVVGAGPMVLTWEPAGVEAIFGVRDSERMRRFHAQIVATIGSFNPLVMVFAALRHDFLGLGPWARFRRDYDAIRAMVFDEIAARRADPSGRSDVLSMLVAARDDQGDGFADQEIFEQLFTLVLAGHETGAASISWACDLVHRHPEVLARLRDDARAPPPRALRAEGTAQRRARGVPSARRGRARRAGVAGVRPALIERSRAAPQGVGAWVHPHPRGKAVGPASEYACAHDR